MTLRTHLFLWIFAATVVPLTVLALGATYYSEERYQRDVQREINAGLANLTVEIDRYLRLEREILRGLTNASAVRDMLPLLRAAVAEPTVEGDWRPSRHLGQFLAEMQAILPGRYTWRLLDAGGNALVKVSNGQVSAAAYESLGGVPYVEQEILDPTFRRRLAELPDAEVSFALLPHHQGQSAPVGSLALMDFLYPLRAGDVVVGALAMSLVGEQIDSIINHAPRLYKGKLSIVEINPDNPSRNGMLIYDDTNQLHLAQIRPQVRTVAGLYDQELLDVLSSRPYGVVRREGLDQSVYFVEFFPYPNLLVSWSVALHIDNSTVAEPFTWIRVGIWAFAATALVVSLAFANIAARKIARPVRLLAANLKAFADGDRQLRIQPHGVAEIGELARSFNYMAGHIERARAERDKAQHMMLQSAKLASIGQMAAGIGHELNNPLNNILSLSKLLARNAPADQPALRRDLASLREEALRASRIVNGILNFARQVPPHFAPFEVSDWVDSTLGLVRQQAKSKAVILASSVQGIDTFVGDHSQLQQALVNLLLNAIYAGPCGSEVSVEVTVEDDNMVVAVRDSGPGVAEQDKDRIFDPFFTTKPVGEGSGLGLSVSLGIVEHHGGSLQLINHPEQGAVATMRLPLRSSTQGAASLEDSEHG